VPWAETLRAMLDLQKQGKVRELGMSNVSVKALSSTFVSLQAEYNLLERTVENDGTLKTCQKKNLSLIAYSPLDQGRIESALLNSLAQKYEKTVTQIILAWLIGHDSVIAIPKSINPKHIKENAEARNINLQNVDRDKIDKEFFQEIVYIATDNILVSSDGERDRQVYQTLNEAMENRLGFTPSPMELALSLRDGGFAKPVRLVPIAKNRFALINGRIRYWAWVIAFKGKKPIPAYIRHDLK